MYNVYLDTFVLNIDLNSRNKKIFRYSTVSTFVVVVVVIYAVKSNNRVEHTV